MRHQFIPVRKLDIVAALAGDAALANAPGGDDFAQFCRLLAATIHYEAHDQLEALKHAYFHFNPRLRASAQRSDEAYAALTAALERVLRRANFVEIGAAELDRARRARGLLPVEVRASTDGYRQMRVFARGSHMEQHEEPAGLLGLSRRRSQTAVYDDVVLIAATKPGVGKTAKRGRRAGDGAVLIKYFHDIASADLDSLLPDVRVVMNNRDRWTLGLPALIGGVPLMIKLVPTLAILLVIAGIHFGYTGTVEQDHLKQALAVMSGLAALGGFAAHQWLKYQRKALHYLIAVKDSIYFRNVNNNGGVFDALVGAGEEQDFKEALLAYRFLLAEPSDEMTLDTRVEAWLAAKFGVDIDFEVTDALATLESYGLLSRDGPRLSVPAIGEALRRLDQRWDETFDYHRPAA
jgi:hypothetical protein